MSETREVIGKILKIEFEEKKAGYGTLNILKVTLNENRYVKASNYKKPELTKMIEGIFEGNTVKIIETQGAKGYWDMTAINLIQTAEEVAKEPNVEKITTSVGGENLVEETCKDKQYVRIMSVRFAIELSAKETPIKDILDRAKEIEEYINR